MRKEDEIEKPRGVYDLKLMFCENCQEEFKQKKWWQTFCSGKCRSEFHNKRNLAILRAAKGADRG